MLYGNKTGTAQKTTQQMGVWPLYTGGQRRCPAQVISEWRYELWEGAGQWRSEGEHSRKQEQQGRKAEASVSWGKKTADAAQRGGLGDVRCWRGDGAPQVAKPWWSVDSYLIAWRTSSLQDSQTPFFSGTSVLQAQLSSFAILSYFFILYPGLYFANWV